ncbi:lipase maturation factor family protein [Streptacidiphilus rugosus]|uniref:lipase maturation factor family protein n=1 Tax=Streptacidiphilus rugosus TaxID=405783 RepID=UPI00055C73F7|nr:lipase maturation factor family protein [Streptacidiphilus rugosus]
MRWLDASGYWLGRLLFQRALAGVYLVGFLAAARQGRALIGEHGLLPVPRFLARRGWREAPSLFHWGFSDRLFAGVAWTGCALAAAVAAGAGDAVPLWAAMLGWFLLWALYLSIVNVGQTWYSFGWESLLLETGALAVFLGNAEVAPPFTTLLLIRWILFRVEVGAGLIKLRGDRCWRELTCLYYHHETQPMPGPLSWWFHHLPRPLHRVEAGANHVVQLGAPFALFLPQPGATVAAGLVVVTQLWLVLSGNFAWLNWLTITLALGAVSSGTERAYPAGPLWFQAAALAYAALVLVLSYRPARNLLSSRQVMNRSFDSLHLVNTYGAFGSVTRLRHEVVLEGTVDGRTWLAYEFPGKPGDPHRRPRQFAPYHLRLDWLMWFAALNPGYAGPWLGPLLRRLLAADPATLRLLRRNGDPFGGAPPVQVRATLYRYRFTTRAERRASGAWWHRELVGPYHRTLTRSPRISPRERD